MAEGGGAGASGAVEVEGGADGADAAQKEREEARKRKYEGWVATPYGCVCVCLCVSVCVCVCVILLCVVACPPPHSVCSGRGGARIERRVSVCENELTQHA